MSAPHNLGGFGEDEGSVSVRLDSDDAAEHPGRAERPDGLGFDAIAQVLGDELEPGIRRGIRHQSLLLSTITV
jgi:hypothetical protein